jgi:predicted Rossmann fold nucleotide-binding protein DprA/Smf involved in DNA uptake
VGTNNLLKEGAIPVTAASDILNYLNLPTHETVDHKAKRTEGSNKQEQLIIDLLERGICDANELLNHSELPVELFNHHMTMLEIATKVRPMGANQWGLA